MKIIELTLLTDDISETEKFYSDRLGIKIFEKSKTTISFTVGTTLLTFIKSTNQNPVYHFAFNIPNNKLDEALSFIENTIGIITTNENDKIAHFENWNAKSFYFKDNNGNILELITRFDLDNKSDKGYNNSLIQSVSEIGISVDNVLNECDNNILKYNLNYFAKQKPVETFAALGDDNGLIIFAKNKRSWFPTDNPSGKHWTKLKFENNGQTNEIEYHGG
jgi:catechol 2,3-dioxygenase-like lactoylglutathione lyase family enzyme